MKGQALRRAWYGPLYGQASFHPCFHVRGGLIVWMGRGRGEGEVVGGK